MVKVKGVNLQKNKGEKAGKPDNFYLFLLVSVFAFSCVPVFVCSCAPIKEDSEICFQQHCFIVEIADEPDKQQRGLMFRESMPKDHGMLFAFEKDGIYPFWMKNTLIPLDMIWLDEDMKVVYIEENVEPCKKDPCSSYGPKFASRFVLELNAGMCRHIELEVGSVLRYKKLR